MSQERDKLVNYTTDKTGDVRQGLGLPLAAKEPEMIAKAGNPPIPFARKKEIVTCAFTICNEIEANKIEGMELCFLDNICHLMMEE